MSNPSDELTLVRTDTFENVPRKLFENSDDEFLTSEIIDRIYEYNNIICDSPATIVYEMQDDKGETQGVAWFMVDLIFDTLMIRFLAVRPEYRDRTVAPKVSALAEQLANYLGISQLLGSTRRDPSYWSQIGWQTANTKIIYKEI